jgi:hypothetical protein
MSIYLYEPTDKLLSATEEFKNKGIAGRRAIPSQSKIQVIRNQFSPESAEVQDAMWMALGYISTGSKVSSQSGNVFKPMNLQRTPLPLPRLQFATSKMLSEDTIKKYHLRKMPSVRVSKDVKGLYSTQATIEEVIAIGSLDGVIKGWSAPPGFGSANELRAFEVLKRILCAMVGYTGTNTRIDEYQLTLLIRRTINLGFVFFRQPS